MPAAHRFADRREAGRLLARALDLPGGTDAVVFGIPRGGVVVAAAVAEELDAPLDVVVVRKLGYPGHEEAAFGAVGEGGIVMPDWLTRIPPSERAAGIVREAIDRRRAEVEERVGAYRAGRPRTSAAGRTAVVVDDGLATGYTFAAALEVVAGDRPAHTIGAVPVGASEGLALAGRHCDQVRALTEAPAGTFFAVSLYYERFGQVEEAEVRACLEGH